MKRKALSAKLRFDIFKRDCFTCQYCGDHPPKVILHVDHIHPVSQGGCNDESNLVTSCHRCNSGKGAILLSVAPTTLAQKASDAKEAEKQLAGYAEVMDAVRRRVEEDAWEVAEQLQSDARSGYDASSFESIKRMVKLIGKEACLEAVSAMWTYASHLNANRRFRYFCGVCHKMHQSGNF